VEIIAEMCYRRRNRPGPVRDCRPRPLARELVGAGLGSGGRPVGAEYGLSPQAITRSSNGSVLVLRRLPRRREHW